VEIDDDEDELHFLKKPKLQAVHAPVSSLVAESSKGKGKAAIPGKQQEYLDRLASGGGLTEAEVSSILVRCYICGKFFMADVLEDHNQSCFEIAE